MLAWSSLRCAYVVGVPIRTPTTASNGWIPRGLRRRVAFYGCADAQVTAGRALLHGVGCVGCRRCRVPRLDGRLARAEWSLWGGPLLCSLSATLTSNHSWYARFDFGDYGKLRRAADNEAGEGEFEGLGFKIQDSLNLESHAPPGEGTRPSSLDSGTGLQAACPHAVPQLAS